jgi:hypothetical protein
VDSGNSLSIGSERVLPDLGDCQKGFLAMAEWALAGAFAMLSKLYGEVNQSTGEMNVMGMADRRYRLSIEAEVFETGEYATTIHTHTRNLEVFEFPNLQDARDFQSKVMVFATGLRNQVSESPVPESEPASSS